MSIPVEDLLIKSGQITEGQLKRARAFGQKRPGRRLAELLIELGYVKEEGILSCLAEDGGFRIVDLDQWNIDPRAAETVSGFFAGRHHLIPIGFEKGTLLTAVSSPPEPEVREELEAEAGMKASFVLALERQISSWIAAVYGSQELKLAAANVEQEMNAQETGDEKSPSEVDTPIVKMVRTMIEQAYCRGASDIHVEPGEEKMAIRLRINGELRPYASMSMEAHRAVVTRLKVMGNMDIAVKTLPQDGRCRYCRGSVKTDLRIATLPGVYGEKVVLRLLDTERDNHLLDVEKMGMIPRQIQMFDRFLSAPYGLILVTGPTGSGKTTTLYGALKRLARQNINIMTAEDPVEKLIPGVNQLQIQPRAGLTFPASLRAILRQDPDVIMVGEIRDEETAQISLRAAITGHLVLSTLHTGDCASAVSRLLDLRAEPYFVSAALTGVIAQRLVKELCPCCRKAYEPDSDQLRRFYRIAGEEGEHGSKPVFWRPQGCSRCYGSGWKGRRAVYEMMEVDEQIREMILSGASLRSIRDYYRKKGNPGLRSLGTAMVKSGETTLEELEKLVYFIE